MSARASLRPAAAQVGLDVEVDLERLGPLPLLGQHAVGAERPAGPAARCGRLTALGAGAGSAALAGQVGDQRDQLPADRAHLAVQDLLDDGDGLGPVDDQAGPAQVAGHHAHEPVAQLLLVDEDLLPGRQPVAQLAVEVGQDRDGIVVGAERDVGPGDAELVVGVQVVGRRQQRDDPGEALAPQPEDLLLAADPAVVAGVAAGPLADGQLVLDDPGEEAGRDPPGPLALS